MNLPLLKSIRGLLGARLGCGCEVCPGAPPVKRRKLILFGSPNVGKSVIFGRLTRSYATVSNYPGTTVEVARGRARVADTLLDVIDSPGTYSLVPFSEEERVARDLLLDELPDFVLHVVDAKSLHRALPLTLELMEAGLPVVLDLNIIDEATRAGLTVDVAALSDELEIPVVATAAASGLGIDRLQILLADGVPAAPVRTVAYPDVVEAGIQDITKLLKGRYEIAYRAVALLLLQRDRGIWERVTHADPEVVTEIERVVGETEKRSRVPVASAVAVARGEAADRIAQRAFRSTGRPMRPTLAEILSRLAMHPVAGMLMLAAALYVGLYLIVGRLGAGVLVDFLDRRVFAGYLNPAATSIVQRVLPWPAVSSLFVGEYGVVTLGLRYAIAIVLPLVAAFFVVFALLEDSGYLPRLALLLDRMFKRIGLSGQAVIPIVLGFGCDTMATLVTRVLPSRRERVIATFLLALAIPCSAQLGVILGLLSRYPLGMAIWGTVIAAVFLFSGFLAARLLPGEQARFYLEIPPMRLPSLRNVLAKTGARVKWYAAEVIPLFLLASVVIWIGDLTRLFRFAVAALRPAVNLIGLPDAAADAFLFGFFRRDYGAARIFDIHASEAVSGVPLVVAMVTITLFVPCIAQFLVMVKERGIRTAAAVAAIILPFALGVGYLLNFALTGLGVKI